jgi:arabinan endo-1,5-alpha-L-arabinosidase
MTRSTFRAPVSPVLGLAVLLLQLLSSVWGQSSLPSASLPLRGNLGIHDPSTIVRCSDTLYVFGTGPGIISRSSKDKVFWSTGPRVFAGVPSWTTNAVPGFAGVFWAPDVLFFNNQYHLYYSVSTWGSQVSAIGLVTNPTLDPQDAAYRWTDRGAVIQSAAGSPYNTIDPSVTFDSNGRLWLVFGSYWSGIYLVQLDPTTGLRIAPDSPTYRLAYNSSIEASCIYRRGEYYYLFVDWGSCCAGVNSTYNIRVGRSASITGPYIDRNGTDMVNRGGALFLRGTGKFIGPGHVGVLSDNGREWFSYHYYDANAWSRGYNAYGAATLGLAPLSWTADDWPVFTNDWSAFYKFQADAREENGQYYGLLRNGASIQSDPIHGRVLNLDGTSQYVWLPPGVAYGQTFAAVVKWRGGGPWQRIFDFGFDTSRTLLLTPASGDNVLRCDINPGGNLQTVQWTKPLPANVWTHVALTLDGNRGVLYVNGSPVATNTSMNVLPLNVMAQTNHLGRSKFPADPYFDGQYASFRVYGRALSPTEIVAPLPEIAEPRNGSSYSPGVMVKFSGAATDFADVPLAATNFSWRIEYSQDGRTNVVFGPLVGATNGTFVVPTNATAGGVYTVVLTATDQFGRRNSAAVRLLPGNPPSGWSSFYPFNTGPQDASNLFNGTFQGGPTIQNDPSRGNVLNLSGNNQYMRLPAGVSSAQTFSGWVKWFGGGAWQRIFDFGQNTSAFFFLTPSDSSGLVQAAITADQPEYVQVIQSTDGFPANQWAHVAVVIDGVQGILYLNGNAVAVNNSVNLLPSDVAGTNCYFGKSLWPDPYLSARLDSVRLNSAALSLAEIRAPSALITAPALDWRFAGGDFVHFAGAAADYSGAELPPNCFTWAAEFHHDGVADSVFGPLSGVANGSFQVSTNAPLSTNLFFRLLLAVTDTNGNQQSVSADVLPRISQLNFATVPPGLLMSLAGYLFSAPTSLVAVAGINRVLNAPSPQNLWGSNYSFIVWSDGGAAIHQVLIPLTNASFTASFVQPELFSAWQGTEFKLLWPQWAGAMKLYTATDLSTATNWFFVNTQPSNIGGFLTVSFPQTNGSQFYRLQWP